jgi:hypothetical protein
MAASRRSIALVALSRRLHSAMAYFQGLQGMLRSSARAGATYVRSGDGAGKLFVLASGHVMTGHSSLSMRVLHHIRSLEEVMAHFLYDFKHFHHTGRCHRVNGGLRNTIEKPRLRITLGQNIDFSVPGLSYSGRHRRKREKN